MLIAHAETKCQLGHSELLTPTETDDDADDEDDDYDDNDDDHL